MARDTCTIFDIAMRCSKSYSSAHRFNPAAVCATCISHSSFYDASLEFPACPPLSTCHFSCIVATTRNV